MKLWISFGAVCRVLRALGHWASEEGSSGGGVPRGGWAARGMECQWSSSAYSGFPGCIRNGLISALSISAHAHRPIWGWFSWNEYGMLHVLALDAKLIRSAPWHNYARKGGHYAKERRTSLLQGLLWSGDCLRSVHHLLGNSTDRLHWRVRDRGILADSETDTGQIWNWTSS